VVNYPSADVNYTRIVEYKHYLNQKSPHTVFFYEHSKDVDGDGDPYYPVPNEKNQVLYKQYQKMADKEKDTKFVGRLANYKYFNMDQSIKNALELFDKDTGYVYKPETTPVHIRQQDWSKPLATSTFPKPKHRVIIDGQHMHAFTGGPEALLQLGMAFKSFLPDGMVYWLRKGLEGKHPNVINANFLT
jgi:hypothetical protein